MHVIRSMMLLTAAFLISGCDSFAALPTGGKSRIGAVYYHYVNPFLNYERTVNITSAGEMAVVEQRGHKPEDTIRFRANLTDAQRFELRDTFKEWGRLKPAYSVDVTEVIEISYGGHLVQSSGGASTPDYFLQGKAALDKILQPLVMAHRPKPATAPATAPTQPDSNPK